MNVTQSLLIIALLFPLLALSIYAVLKPKRKEQQHRAEQEERPVERVRLKLNLSNEEMIEIMMPIGQWTSVPSVAVFVGDRVRVKGEPGDWVCVRANYKDGEAYLEPVK